MKNKLIMGLLALIFLVGCSKPKIKVLVFSKTEAFRHQSIEAGITAIKKMAEEKGFDADFSEDASLFTEKNLANYNAVIFLNTTGEILDNQQQDAFERYIQAGGGFVGIHSATDTEYDWPWYGELVGAYFLDHPNDPSNVQKGKFTVLEKGHWATEGMPDTFERSDEFYNFKDIKKHINPVLSIDEKSYIGGKNPDFHPMSWYHEFDGGRAFYTALGHTDESYSDPLFLNHVWAGIKYAAGGDKIKPVDFSKSRPEENRFTKVVLADKLDEPMELTVLDDDRVLYIQRKGELMLYDNKTGKVTEVAKIPTSTKYVNKEGKQSEAEDGLLGLNKDPNFAKNNWIYIYYSLPEKSVNALVRYEFKDNKLVESSKKIVLEVPVQREECCHAGGSVAWDKDGNLYLSTGDNTNPHGSNGYSPSDERLGRESWDAQKSSANTNDLRGKILRIKPQADGSYTIPEGNLFPKGTPKTRPEIFSMGHRNPFRIAIDQRNGYVYWGDVGPDARESNPDRGPEGHDEVGQAKKAGNFGWPHFVGNNKAYNKYDFTTNTSGAEWDAKKPLNTSPNNTGLNELPEAQNAFIWYPYANSAEFPLMGNGGRNAMAGPVYYKDDFKKAARPFPSYYDKKLFVYEWMRGFIMSVTLDKNGNFVRMERFLPNMTFNNPMDMEFAPNGDLYMLEYGTGWFTQNDNARLIKIEYNAGNRKPIAEASSSVPGGALPLKVSLSSEGTKDLDDDDLTYSWTVTADNGYKKEFKTENVDLNLDKAGIYKAVLTVKDKQGAEATAQVEITAGNALPVVNIDLPGGNKSFFRVGQAIPYIVTVTDQEDGSIGKGITPDEVVFTADYLAEGFDKIAIAQGHKSADESAIAVNVGKKLIEAGDCKSCHAIDKKSVGPSYMEVAKKYEKKPGAIDYLSDKVIKGGGGVWGEIAMAAHPNLSKKDAESIAKYILGLGQAKNENKLPLSGNYVPTLPKDDPGKGMFIFRAAYADKGSNGLPSVKSDKTFILRNATLDVHGFDDEHEVAKMAFNNMRLLLPQKSGAYVALKNIDLNNVQGVTFLASAPKPQVNSAGGKIEIRIGSPKGTLIGESTILEPSEAMGLPSSLFIPLKANAQLESKLQDVYFVFVNPTVKDRTVMVVTGVEIKLGK